MRLVVTDMIRGWQSEQSTWRFEVFLQKKLRQKWRNYCALLLLIGSKNERKAESGELFVSKVFVIYGATLKE